MFAVFFSQSTNQIYNIETNLHEEWLLQHLSSNFKISFNKKKKKIDTNANRHLGEYKQLCFGCLHPHPPSMNEWLAGCLEEMFLHIFTSFICCKFFFNFCASGFSIWYENSLLHNYKLDMNYCLLSCFQMVLGKLSSTPSWKMSEGISRYVWQLFC